MTPPQKHDDEPILTNREILSDVHKKVTSMHNVIYGDQPAGIPGLSHRVSKLENSEKKKAGLYVLISAISSGIAIAFKTFYDHLK
jgi:hypothetical protein